MITKMGKKILSGLAFITSVAFSFNACTEDKDEAFDNAVDPNQTNTLYASETKQLSVIYKGEQYTTDSIHCECVFDQETKLATLTLVDVKFVPQMPLTVTPVIESVPFTFDGVTYSFKADSIVPLIGGNPFERYPAKYLLGTYTEKDGLKFSLFFDTIPTRFNQNQYRTIVPTTEIGILSVDFKGEEYNTDSTRCSCIFDLDTKLAKLTLKDVKFVPQMPVTVTPVVVDIPFTTDGHTYPFAADSIIPLVDGQPFGKYPAKNIAGTYSQKNGLDFSLFFDETPTRFKSYSK